MDTHHYKDFLLHRDLAQAALARHINAYILGGATWGDLVDIAGIAHLDGKAKGTDMDVHGLLALGHHTDALARLFDTGMARLYPPTTEGIGAAHKAARCAGQEIRIVGPYAYALTPEGLVKGYWGTIEGDDFRAAPAAIGD